MVSSVAAMFPVALVNTDPYGAGWFFKVKLSQPAEADALLNPQQYAAQIQG